jgi:microcystin-dependent protein
MATYRPLIVNAAANQIQELASGDSLTGITTVTATTFIGNVIGNVTGTATSFSGNGITPIGGIIMWSGTVAGISTLTGWALCDGANGTPDLRNRFIVGAHSGAGNGTVATAGPGFNASTGAINANYTPGNSGGETAHQLTIAELAAHAHGASRDDVIAATTGAGTVRTVGSGSIQTSSVGSDNYHENRPPYYALAFIMRTL